MASDRTCTAKALALCGKSRTGSHGSVPTPPGRPGAHREDPLASNTIRLSEADCELSARCERDVMALLDPLYIGALRMTGDRRAAESLVHETVLSAYSGLDSSRTGAGVKTWLFRLMAITWIGSRRRGQRPESESDPDQPADSHSGGGQGHPPSELGWAEPEVLAALPDAAFVQALMALPESLRMILHYAYVEGFHYDEIAEIMQTSVGTVTSRLGRARAEFRTLLVGAAMQQG